MIRGYSPIVQTILGTLFTWAITALGASLVFIFNYKQKNILSISLGFAAGVMLAASYWSLLEPGIQIAQESYGSLAVVPISIGFALGAFFVYICDKLVGSPSPNIELALQTEYPETSSYDEISPHKLSLGLEGGDASSLRHRVPQPVIQNNTDHIPINEESQESPKSRRWRRVLLLIIAITVHNIPEGLAVGVGFAAVNSSPLANFESARNLAIGIGIQNFPEGLAVSLPLHVLGLSRSRALWYGQLSGVVEPLAGVLGALAVALVRPLLPYALAFAAGAMVFVVFDDIIPEAHHVGEGRFASWAAMVGFIVMMTLDVGTAG